MDFWSALQALLLFLSVLFLAWLTTKLYARRMQQSGRLIRVIEVSTPLPGKHLMLVLVAGKVILVGAADKALTHIATFLPEELGDQWKEEYAESPPPIRTSFESALKRLMGR